MVSDPERSADSAAGSEARTSIDSETLIDRLSTGGVLDLGERGTIRIADGFTGRIEEQRRNIADSDRSTLRDDVRAVVDAEDVVDGLVDSLEFDEEFLAEYLALSGIKSLSHEDRLRTLALFDALRNPLPDGGAPEPFVPVRGVRLPLLLPLYERAIVYTWREDCPPCDLMNESLEEVFVEPPDDIALFSVYGPDWAELLHERYDVVGGPTTLFFHEGNVDARLSGAHATGIVRKEVQKLREVAAIGDS